MAASNRLFQTLRIMRFNKEIAIKCNTAFLRVSLRLQARKDLPFFLQFGWEFNTDSRCRPTCLQLPEDGMALLPVKLQERTECIHVLRKTAVLYPLLWTTAPVKSSCPVWASRSSWELTFLGEEEKKESKKQLWKKKGWFYHGLVSWTASLRQCWVPEQVEKKCYPKWRSGRHSHTLGSSKFLGWQISLVFDSLLCHLPGCFLPCWSTVSQLNLPFTSSPVSSHVSLPSPPPCQFLWPIYANPKPWYLQLRTV